MEFSKYGSIFSITEFGAVSGNTSPCTQVFKDAIEACCKTGGGTVYVPAGTFFTGAIEMRSNITLWLDNGANLVFVNDFREYPCIVSRWEGVEVNVYSPCIYAKNATNISITGNGVIDGQGEFWWKAFHNGQTEYPRPTLIGMNGCDRITIEGIKLVNSPSWTINPICSHNVTIDKVTIKNPANSPNTDGINPDSCSNVHISNCHIDVGDDCIAIKSGTEQNIDRIPCENITITNCTMVHGHGGVVLGSEMSGDIRNVTISNCVFKNTDRGIRIKSRRGRGGVIEDVRINNIIMNGVLCPFVGNLFYFCGPGGKDKFVWDKELYPVTEKTPVLRRIHFSNITATETRAAAGFFYGLPESKIEEITFDNIFVSLAKYVEPGMPDMLDQFEPVAQQGFICKNIKSFKFTNVTVSGQKGVAFSVEKGEDIEFIQCKNQNSDGSQMFELVNVI